MYLVTFVSKLNGVQARRLHHKRPNLWGSRPGCRVGVGARWS